MISIAIVGSGALGIYYGTRLGRAGYDVRFLMRSDLEAVQARGSTILHLEGQALELRPVQAYATTAEIGRVDLVLVATKTTTLDTLPALIFPLLGPATGILTFQNGLGPDQFLADQFGAQRIMGGLAMTGINRIGPGKAMCLSAGRLLLGEFGRPISDRLRTVASCFQKAGVEVQLTDSLAAGRWLKLVWNVPFNGLAIAAGGVATDRITSDPGLAEQAKGLMTEIQRASTALGFPISDEYIKNRYDGTVKMPAYRPSSLVDYLAGREVEVEAIWGEPLRQAQAAGIDCPRLKLLYGLLRGLCGRPTNGTNLG